MAPGTPSALIVKTHGSRRRAIYVPSTPQLKPAWTGAVSGVLIGLSLAGPAWSVLAWPALLLWAVGIHVSQDRRQEVACLAWGVWAWSGVGTVWVAAAVQDASDPRLLWQWLTMLVSVLHHSVCVMLPWVPVRWSMGRGATARQRLAAWAIALASGEAWRQWGWAGHGYASLAAPLSAVPGAALPLSLVGGLGLSAIGCGAAAVAARALLSPDHRGPRRMAAVAAVLLPMLLAVPWRPTPSEASTHADGWQVVALATHIDHGQASSRPGRDRQLAALDQAMQLAGAGQAVVTPETFFAEPPPQRAEGVWADLLRQVDASGVTLLLGMPHALYDETGLRIINTALQLAPGRASMYGKRRLVPGGEYLPWPTLMGWVDGRVFGRTLEGPSPAPEELVQSLLVAGHATGVLICHEMSFALEAAERAADTEWLVVLSEDGWIDHPMYRQQMVALARLRAMETGLPLLRVANGGPTLLALPDGQVQRMWPMRGARIQPWPVVVPAGSTASFYARSAAPQWWLLALFPLVQALPAAFGHRAPWRRGVPA
ncbi:apolipoprotein N-acyltransferase [Ideonella sp. 4Y16]|uniref:apolipoprotein N-acyltransferase n=1 Tax=Ideonella alba TaxID=2824118 RepID=UPI001B359C38|nr:apolipoprotein N-acyltransferase [Ideonella alba]MBQ0945558.1 apolipoprotein N-acyltransferase [Ideonella alba]